MKRFFTFFLYGFAIGVAAILPGVSGGILAVGFGVYEAAISALTGFFRDWRKNGAFLLPLFIGGVAGVLATSNALQQILALYEAPILALFTGFVLGNLPWLFLEARGQNRFKKRYVLAAALGLLAVLLFGFMETLAVAGADTVVLSPVTAMLSGAVLAVGVIIPGISASFLLIYMGTYEAILSAIASISLRVLFFAGLGFLAMGLVLLALVNTLFKRFRDVCYFAIAGFVVGSVILVLPQVVAGMTWICPFLFVLGLAISVLQGYVKARKIILGEPFAGETSPGPIPEAVLETAGEAAPEPFAGETAAVPGPDAAGEQSASAFDLHKRP